MTHSPPRLEIQSIHRNPANRRTFRLVLHDRGPRVVWTGNDYDAAILASEKWARQGVDVIDRVDVGDINAPSFVPRVPAVWRVVESLGVVDGLHVEVWRSRRLETDRVIIALSPTTDPLGFKVALSGDDHTIPVMKSLASVVVAALQAAGARRHVQQDLI